MKKDTVLLATLAIVAGILFVVAGLLWMADVWGPLKENEQPCALQLPLKWFGCVIGRQRDLAGGLIGAAGTIIAGIIAWRAAIKTIDATRAKESAAFEVANQRIGTIAKCFNQVWRVVDRSLQGDGDPKSGAMLIFQLLPSDELLNDWAEQLQTLAREFDAKRKIDLEYLAEAVRSVRSCIPEDRKPQVVDERWLNRLRNTLNSFKHRCEKFNPIDRYFEGRKSSPLDLREDWEHIAGLVNIFEEKGRLGPKNIFEEKGRLGPKDK